MIIFCFFKLGITGIFNESCQFGRLIDKKDKKPIRVSKFLQNVTIEIGDGDDTGKPELDKNVDVCLRADHPFLYNLWDDDIKMILLSGQYTGPK